MVARRTTGSPTALGFPCVTWLGAGRWSSLLWTCLPWCVMIQRCGLACVGKHGRGGEGMGSGGSGKGLVCVVPLVGGQWAARSSAENRNYLRNYDTEIPIRYRYTGIPPGKRYRKSYRSVNDNLTRGGRRVAIAATRPLSVAVAAVDTVSHVGSLLPGGQARRRRRRRPSPP